MNKKEILSWFIEWLRNTVKTFSSTLTQEEKEILKAHLDFINDEVH